MVTTCAQHVHSTGTTCSQPIHDMFRTWARHVHVMVSCSLKGPLPAKAGSIYNKNSEDDSPHNFQIGWVASTSDQRHEDIHLSGLVSLPIPEESQLSPVVQLCSHLVPTGLTSCGRSATSTSLMSAGSSNHSKNHPPCRAWGSPQLHLMRPRTVAWWRKSAKQGSGYGPHMCTTWS